jgi:hypothetical protein
LEYIKEGKSKLFKNFGIRTQIYTASCSGTLEAVTPYNLVEKY